MHAQWYADTVPAMIPVALLGSVIYLSLQLAQSHLAHEKYLDVATARVLELEAEVDALQIKRRLEQEGGTTVQATTTSGSRWRLW